MRLDVSFRASLEAMTASYEATLATNGWEVAAYLKGRGIGKETAVSYRLGLVNDEFPEHEQYKGMLCIPYQTILGGVVSLKFRRPHDCTDQCQHSKYVGPYSTRLYNTIALDEADSLGYVFITEGEIDAIILGSNGYPAVGVPGVESWKAHPEWRDVLAGYPRVFLVPDSDEPGIRLAKHIQADLRGTARIIRLPGAKDVNDCYVREGRDQFRGIIDGYIQAG